MDLGQLKHPCRVLRLPLFGSVFKKYGGLIKGVFVEPEVSLVLRNDRNCDDTIISAKASNWLEGDVYHLLNDSWTVTSTQPIQILALIEFRENRKICWTQLGALPGFDKNHVSTNSIGVKEAESRFAQMLDLLQESFICEIPDDIIYSAEIRAHFFFDAFVAPRYSVGHNSLSLVLSESMNESGFSPKGRFVWAGAMPARINSEHSNATLNKSRAGHGAIKLDCGNSFPSEFSIFSRLVRDELCNHPNLRGEGRRLFERKLYFRALPFLLAKPGKQSVLQDTLDRKSNEGTVLLQIVLLLIRRSLNSSTKPAPTDIANVFTISGNELDIFIRKRIKQAKTVNSEKK